MRRYSDIHEKHLSSWLTGSIGTQTLDVVRANGDIHICALAAGSNIKLLEQQIREFHPSVVSVWGGGKSKGTCIKVADCSVRIVSGMEGLIEAATVEQAEIVVTAVVGMIGIRPTIAAIEAGKDIALANKETLVTADILLCHWQHKKIEKFCQWIANIPQFSSL